VSEEKKRTPTYWICNDCADKKGLVCKKTGNTVILGLCGHCENPMEIALTPVRDFVRKKNDNQ
jgi:transcription elongation factor Elf1